MRKIFFEEDNDYFVQKRFNNDNKNNININPDEIDRKDIALTGDIRNIKSEQEIKVEDKDFNQSTATLQIKSEKRAKKFGIPSECPECGLAERTLTKLEEHVKNVHNTALRFPCDHCDKKLSRKRLKEHKQVVLGMKLKYSCKYCDKMFPSSGSLTIRVRIHTAQCSIFHINVTALSVKNNRI